VVHVSPDGRSIQALVQHGACERGTRRIEIKEAPAEVRVRVLGAQATGGACNAVLLSTRLSATLRAPLGSRQLMEWDGRRPLKTVSP